MHKKTKTKTKEKPAPSALSNMHVGLVEDMYVFHRPHYYPCKEEDKHKLTKKYDFIFTRKGFWYYVASHDDHEIFEAEGYTSPIENRGENWRVLNALTGEIIHQNKN